MKSNRNLKPLALAIGTALAAGATGAAQAEPNPFGASLLAAGYMVDSVADPVSGGTPPKKADEKAKEGKCGEGKCGGEKKAGDKAKEGKCGEGKCGEGKCGGAKKDDKAKEGKCGGDHAKAKEGKCGSAT